MAKKDATDELQPWDRQPGESEKAFEAFRTFRDMGLDGDRRTVAEVSRRLQKNYQTLKEWRAKFRWDDRCREFDVEQDRIHLEEKRRQIDQTNKNHVNLAQAMLAKVARRLQKLKPEELGVKDLNTMVEVATKLERLALGMSTVNLQNEVSGPGGAELPSQVVHVYIPSNGRPDQSGGGDNGGANSSGD